MKKIVLTITTLVLTFILVSCSKGIKNNEIHVGVSFYPMKDILELVEADLKESGYKLVIHEFSSYQVANDALKNNELDFNMIQHEYFLEEFNKANNAQLEISLPIYHATFALYSSEYDDLSLLPNGSKITLPDDTTNFSRALYLLGQAGLLTFKDNKTLDLTVEDISSNPKNLDLTDKVPLTTLANRYKETKLAIMYPTYAKSLELVGDEDRLYVEKQDNVTKGYAIGLAGRQDNKTSDKFETLSKLIKSDQVKAFLIENYDWASKPAF